MAGREERARVRVEEGQEAGVREAEDGQGEGCRGRNKGRDNGERVREEGARACARLYMCVREEKKIDWK